MTNELRPEVAAHLAEDAQSGEAAAASAVSFAMGLPVAFLGAFVAMAVLGLSLNMMTLVALLMAIGRAQASEADPLRDISAFLTDPLFA